MEATRSLIFRKARVDAFYSDQIRKSTVDLLDDILLNASVLVEPPALLLVRL